jgi:hypothetical protein
MPCQEQIKAFVDYMTAKFPPPATMFPGEEAGRYRVSVQQGGVERWVYASFELLEMSLEEIRRKLEEWNVAGMAQISGAGAVLVTRDGARIIARA